MPTTVPELIDIETLAHLLGDSVRHVRRLVAERRVPYLKVGHFVRFDPAEIVEWLDNARQPGRLDRPGPSHRTAPGHRG
jgi:excisionase family DNA binding protein